MVGWNTTWRILPVWVGVPALDRRHPSIFTIHREIHSVSDPSAGVNDCNLEIYTLVKKSIQFFDEGFSGE